MTLKQIVSPFLIAMFPIRFRRAWFLFACPL